MINFLILLSLFSLSFADGCETSFTTCTSCCRASGCVWCETSGGCIDFFDSGSCSNYFSIENSCPSYSSPSTSVPISIIIAFPIVGLIVIIAIIIAIRKRKKGWRRTRVWIKEKDGQTKIVYHDGRFNKKEIQMTENPPTSTSTTTTTKTTIKPPKIHEETLENSQEPFYQPNYNIEQPNLSYQPDPNMNFQPNPNMNFQPDPNMNFQPNPNMNFQPDPNMNFQPNPNMNFQPDPNMNFQPDPNMNFQPDPNMNFQPNPNMNFQN
ncbi:hypothetical protein M0811_05911 [Anaeramoeba ignava]|uniref:Uncharacterized protein n=1 Tax=Anaeramoeba ignava TaxID=1746090 RepID=A0A9Q0LR06_ANAIG|nr:hypothetical protein M0811_05911 [Anaeramoeba ignava]